MTFANTATGVRRVVAKGGVAGDAHRHSTATNPLHTWSLAK